MADLKSLRSRLDPELKGMLNRLLESLTEYEASVQPLVSEYKKVKGQIKKSQKGLPTQQVKSAILELLNQKGFDTTLDYHPGNFNNLQRAISSLIATDPGLWPDLIENALSAGAEQGSKIISSAQTGLVKDFLNVGHHEQGLKSLRPVLEALQGMGQSLRERTLHVLETKYGFDFGELGLRHILPFAHTEGSLGPGRGPTGIRKDFQPLLDEAFPELGGVKSIDQINQNLRQLIKPLLAHSKAQHGTGGIIPPVDLIKNLTDPNEIAEALRPFLDAQKAGAENAMRLSDTIWKHGLKKVNGEWILNKDAWLPDGALQKAIENLPVTQLAPENQWGKAKKIIKPTVKQIQRFGSKVPIADTSRLNQTLKILPKGRGISMLLEGGKAFADTGTALTTQNKGERLRSTLGSTSALTGLASFAPTLGGLGPASIGLGITEAGVQRRNYMDEQGGEITDVKLRDALNQFPDLGRGPRNNEELTIPTITQGPSKWQQRVEARRSSNVGSNLAKQRLDREIMVEATKRRQALSNFIDLEDPAMN